MPQLSQFHNVGFRVAPAAPLQRIGARDMSPPASSPLLTEDQRHIETLALRIAETLEVRRAREHARSLLLADPVAAIPEGRIGLDRALDQWTLALHGDAAAYDASQFEELPNFGPMNSLDAARALLPSQAFSTCKMWRRMTPSRV